MNRRSFLSNLLAGGFGLAVGQTVEVKPVEAKIQTDVTIVGIPSDVWSNAHAFSMDTDYLSMSHPMVFHHLNIQFSSTNPRSLEKLRMAMSFLGPTREVPGLVSQ